jgi:CBS domain-containing protein
MRVSDLLRTKGQSVATIAPDATVSTAVDELRQHGVGALVVSADGITIDGIVSERDVVRHLASVGASVVDQSVRSIMTAEVSTCGRGDGLDALMEQMTDRRIRHLPVVSDGRLDGIISIGDVVKARLAELETEKQHLSDYISTGR